MKQLYKYTAAMLALTASATFTSCDDDFDRPPVIVPEASIEANTTIAQLKETYWNDATNYADTIGYTAEGDHIIISGRVISSDETGNIYKSLVIQDETAALALSIGENDLYEKYMVGQEIVIDATDMYIGKYNGLQQLGLPEPYNGTYEVTFMPIETFTQHAQLNGLPQPSQIDTLVTTIADIEAAKSSAQGLQKWQSQLVRLDSVYFKEAGKPFSDASASTNRTLVDPQGNTIMLRNSSYATFQSELLPVGKGCVVGILSYYGRSGWQLLLRSTNDCIGFTGTPSTPQAPSTTEAVTTLDETFEGIASVSDLQGWSSVTVSGEKDWYFTTFDNNTYAACTAFKGTDPTDGSGYDSWLITPPLNIDEMEKKIFNFESQAAYSGDCTLEVYAMTTADPSQATLTKLDCTIATPPSSGYSGFVSSGNISLEQFTGVIYIGFRYKATTSSASKTYCVDNVKAGIETSASTPSDTPSTSGEGSAASPYTVDNVLAGTTANGVWVTGYIVGWIDTTGDNYEVSAETATFTTPATINTNLLMAASANETNVSKCIPVQLPSGSVRSALNLVDNPTNLGKQVSLKCDITKYFGLNGLKNATTYTWGATGEEQAETPATTASFKKVTAVTAGKSYLIVAAGKAATPLTSTYGYLKVVDVTDNGGIITADTALSFTLNATNGGYSITDPSGNIYYMTGDYNSFNVQSTMPSEGGVWSITPQSDGTFVISNTLKSKSIQYDANYTSFGSYPDTRGTFPSLYEKVD